MEWSDTLVSFVTALGLGLMIGVVRERRHHPDLTKAGTRTHALVAVVGCVCWGLGVLPFVAALVVVGALAVMGYVQTADKDPGQTGEVALLMTYVLAGLARQDPPLAAGLAVLAAILLQAKSSLQRLSREWISEREMQDGLMLAASALVVMPLLPTSAVDPWGVLYPTTLWRIVVLVMAVGMFGHVAQRAIGTRWGLPVAGFFSGFVSSTAAVAGFGRRAKDVPGSLLPAAAAAIFANLASLLLFAAVLGAASPALLQSLAIPLLAGAVALLGVGALCLRQQEAPVDIPHASPARAFRLSQALAVAALIAVVSLVATGLRQLFGDAGVLVAAVLVALVEVHAAAASIAQLAVSGDLAPWLARWGVLAVLGASAVAKSALGVFSGGVRYGGLVGAALAAMVLGSVTATLFLRQ